MEVQHKTLPALPEVFGRRIRHDVTGASLTTLAIGGVLDGFLEVSDLDDLQEVVRVLSSGGSSYRVIGAGSNLLLPSRGLSGLTLRLGRGFRSVETLGNGHVRVGGSYSLMALSRMMSDAGYSGLEFAGGIPASIGGAVVMNAGAHGGQMSDVVERVGVVLPNGTATQIAANDLRFAYRTSSLPTGAVVYEVVCSLVSGDVERSRVLRQELLAHRKSTQPLQSPSAGSVFRNPAPEWPAGKLLEDAGMKGQVAGGARISELHANWIVNEQRTASDEDVRELIERCQKAVRVRHGITLEPEILQWD